jgi:phosphatidylglycerophosphate synthase
MPKRFCFSIAGWAGVQALVWYAWTIDAAIILPAAALLNRSYGQRPAARFLATTGGAGIVRHAFLRWLTTRTSQEAISLGDPLSLARITCANVVAGLVMSGTRDRVGPAGRLAWNLAIVGATALDWLDGPLARRSGATRHGAALDIEADSWLTLWSAVAAASWGGLPRCVIVPPLIRYLHPLLDLRGGGLPQGGRPGLTRLTGSAQMALLLAVLAPIRWRPPEAALRTLAPLACGSQLAAHLLQLGRRLQATTASQHGPDRRAEVV